MPSPFLRAASLVAGSLILAFSTRAAPRTPGYLPTVGPPPLRFDATDPSRPKALLPPLVIPSSEAPAPEVSPAVTGATTAPEPEPAPIVAKPLPFPDFADLFGDPQPTPPPPLLAAPQTNSVTNLVVPMTAEPEEMSPQLFLRFFTRNTTNAPVTNVVAPVGFTPPQPANPIPSSASYTTSP